MVSQGVTLVIAIFYATAIAITTSNVMIASFIGVLITGIIILGFLSKKAAERVMHSVTKFIEEDLKLKVNKDKYILI